MSRKSTEKNKTKHIRLPIHVYLSYLLVAAFVFTGVTFSKYITRTNAGDGARVATFGDLKITETEKKFIITPGVDIKKDPHVSYATEKNSESAAYVFVYVKANNWEFDDETLNTYRITVDNKNGDTGDAGENGRKELMHWSVDSTNWTYVTGDNDYKVFYRYVPPNGQLDNVPVIENDTITVSPELYASDYSTLNSAMRTITFRTYAVQANGFKDAKEAWAGLYKSLNPTAEN